MVHILVAGMIENLPRFICDDSELMSVDNPHNMSEVDDDDTQDTLVESMDNVQDVDDDDTQDTLVESMDNEQDENENEQKSTSNKKYYLLFKPSSSPISNRLRRKRKSIKKQ
jgi:hypothetical protein